MKIIKSWKFKTDINPNSSLYTDVEKLKEVAMFNKYKPSDILWSIIFIVGFYVGVTSLGYGLLLGFVGHLKNIALGIFMLIVTILGLLDMYKK